MTEISAAKDRESWLMSLGLGIGSAIAVFWLVVGAGGILEGEPWTVRSVVLMILYVVAVGSAAIAWWRRGLGGALLIGSGLALIAATIWLPGGEHDHGPTLLTGGLPLIVSGLLLVVARRMGQRG